MDGALAAIADAATGAAVARALEPSAGEGHVAAQTRCLNCGTFLTGAHCHQCGQAAHVHRNIGAFWHDFLHSVLHFEGKAWRTLPVLAWRPGELTRRYIEGERAQFVSPLALFLFTVFLTFAVFNWVGIGDNAEFNVEEAAAIETEFRGASATIDRDLAAARAAITAARTAGEPTAPLEARLRELERGAALFGLGARVAGQETREAFTITDMTTGVPFIDEGVAKANENPALTLYKLQTNSYKFSWLLIPLSAPFLWLLFPFSRRFGWYDHLVFVTYSTSFMMLLSVALRLLVVAGVPGGPLLAIGALYPPFHIYRQLRGAYRCSRFGGVIRALILNILASFTLVMFFLLFIAVGAMG